ncbi:hypothetical protein CAY59_07245 [Vibrio campbellii]|uniref:hypothetical protein n=1 Tax=Vibrio campbellii TaxID=680 RepID=UPI000A2FF8AC|nr:hypothetical protein [Vibrio campbellii]ARR44162.1 hypothetical protein CAY59_07245 [Vibrio campbellii]
MKDNQVGKWLHPAFTATSMAYFLTVLDKTDLVASSFTLQLATIAYAVALVLNGIWAFSYFDIEESSPTISKLLKSNYIAKGFHNLAGNSFLFATGCLVWYVLDKAVTIDWTAPVL